MVALKKVRKQELASQTSDKRRLGLHMRQVLGKGALTLQGASKAVSYWAGEVAFNITLEVHDLSNRVPMSEKMKGIMNKVHGKKQEVIFFAPDSKLEMHNSMTAARGAMQKNINKVIELLDGHLSANTNIYHNMAKLQFKKPVMTTYTNLEWVPKSVATALGPPAPNLAGIVAVPFVLKQRMFGYRSIDSFPCLGLGAWCHALEGSALVVTWPFSALTEKGADPADVESFLGSLTASEFTAFIEHSGHFFEVKVGALAYMPYGWHCLIIGISETSSILWQPWPNSINMNELDEQVKKDVLASLSGFCDQKTSEKTYAGDIAPLQELLGCIAKSLSSPRGDHVGGLRPLQPGS